MSLVGILLIIIGVSLVIILFLSSMNKHIRIEKNILEAELNKVKKNIAQLRTGYSTDRTAVEAQGRIDKMIRGTKTYEEAKTVRDRIVDSITGGLQDYYANNPDTP